MLFDFERFSISVKLAYRRCGGSVYSIDEVLEVFRYYFETYEIVFNEAHPVINIVQVSRIIDRMPYITTDDDTGADAITTEDYETIIDQHFVTRYAACDYNINHFFSGDIRKNRYYETLH